MQQPSSSSAVYEFIERELDGVPYLEALLLLWNSRPRVWTSAEMAAALYVGDSYAREVLQNLTRRELATQAESDLFSYQSASTERDTLVATLETEYRRNLIRITRILHAKASPGVREFADAFRFKKDRES